MDTIANPMGTKKVFPLLISMAVPPMISMMIQSLYNIVDSMFAARLGVNAITAISLAYPLQNLILSVGVGLGVGINACIAMSHGTGVYNQGRRKAISLQMLTSKEIII